MGEMVLRRECLVWILNTRDEEVVFATMTV